jgi:hypothetical protein
MNANQPGTNCCVGKFNYREYRGHREKTVLLFCLFSVAKFCFRENPLNP